MRDRYLNQCQPGDVLEGVYVLTNKQLAAGQNAKTYMKGFLGDKSMTITARKWNVNRDEFDELPYEGFVQVRGRVENYQGNLQIIIEAAWPAKPGTFDLADLVPHTKHDVGEMFDRLTGVMKTIRNKALRALVDAYLADTKLMADFKRAPAAQSFHHAFLGGLLEHTLNTVEAADSICKFYPGLNRDLVVAGIFLHDIAKTWELTYEGAFGYSDGGTLVGHIVKSAMWVDDKRRAAEAATGIAIPQQLVDVMQHIILAHHGEYEFGSPKLPGTPEAIVVHTLENMDAKLMIALAACRGEQGGSSDWTEYLKAFNGRLYRPDVAPADDEEMKPINAPVAAAAVKMSLTNPLFESVPARRKP
jgi:3'-5' exoribonuclease